MTKSGKTPTEKFGGERDPIRRTVKVLTWMAEQGETEHGVREIATGLVMQPSTISRLLAQLSEIGLVYRDPDSGRYSLGLELARIGMIAASKVGEAARARPYLAELTAKTGESSYLSVYDPVGQRMMRVEAVASSNPLQYVVAMNEWVGVLRGASGKAILAQLPDADVRAILEKEGSADAYPELERELEAIRTVGVVCTRGQRTPGAVGIAAPVFNSSGRVFGDIFITVPESRFAPENEQVYALLVRDAADRLTTTIGGPSASARGAMMRKLHGSAPGQVSDEYRSSLKF